jgi:hypothetical protein
MTGKQDRRRFLQTSLVAGAVVTLTSGDAPPGSEPLQASPAAARDQANPAVRPGQVRWHEGFAAACAAGRRSGKPVLLFHMMGRLDQKFC